jgi:hypothetical protein
LIFGRALAAIKGGCTEGSFELIQATTSPVMAATIAFIGPGNAVNDLTFHTWPLPPTKAKRDPLMSAR